MQQALDFNACRHPRLMRGRGPTGLVGVHCCECRRKLRWDLPANYGNELVQRYNNIVAIRWRRNG